jgi:hypothetical protein
MITIMFAGICGNGDEHSGSILTDFLCQLSISSLLGDCTVPVELGGAISRLHYWQLTNI